MQIVLEVIVLLVRVIYYYIEAFVRLFIPQSPKSIRGQVALVTGAGRGIGQAIALRLARAGASVAVLDLDEAAANDTVRIIRDEGGTARAYRCDVTSVKAVADVAAKVRDELGDVDVLVNNAGTAATKSILDIEEREVRRTVDVNLTAQFWTVKEFLPAMIARKRGHIVIMCSMAGKASTQFATDYCSTKHGANGFGDALVEDLGFLKATGINVTTVYPYATQTLLFTDALNRIDYDSRLPILTPDYVAEATVNGVLRNVRYIYLPPVAAAINFIGLFPLKAGRALVEFMGHGFVGKPSR